NVLFERRYSVPETVTASQVPAETRRPIDTKSPSPQVDGRLLAQQAANATAQAVGGAIAAAAKAAGRVTMRQCMAVVLRLIGLISLLVVYQTIQAEGLREIFGEILSKRLFKASALLLGWMANFNETRKLDLANALAAA